MRKLLKMQGITPAAIVTDKLGSYRPALRDLVLAAARHKSLEDNRAEIPISHCDNGNDA